MSHNSANKKASNKRIRENVIPAQGDGPRRRGQKVHVNKYKQDEGNDAGLGHTQERDKKHHRTPEK